MELYEAIAQRHTVRDFEKKVVPQEVLARILEAGMKGPSGNHLRDIHYVVVRGQEEIEKVVKLVGESAGVQMDSVKNRAKDMVDSQRDMYLSAVPKQRKMLIDPGTLVLPFYYHQGDFDHSNGVTTYNNFASTWCGIENILLAATAEGLGCSMRIPTGEEPAYVTKLVGAPEGYVFCCYLGIGYPLEKGDVVEQIPVNVANRVHCNRW